MNARWLFPPLLGLAAFAVGWIADNRANPAADRSTTETSSDAASLRSAQPYGSLRGADDTTPSKLLAFRQAVLLPAGLSRICAIADALDALTLEEFPAVLALAPRQPEETESGLNREIFRRWTRLDPNSAAAAARSLTDFWSQQSANDSIAYEWAKTAAPAAQAWIRTLTPIERSCNGFTLVFALVDWEGDPAATMRAAFALPGELLGESRQHAFSGILTNVLSPWAKRDPQEAVAFAAGIADPVVRKHSRAALTAGPVAT